MLRVCVKKQEFKSETRPLFERVDTVVNIIDNLKKIVLRLKNDM